MICPNCRHDVPAEPYCVRCGTPLEREGEAPAARRGYAAAPNEHPLVPRIVSSLFPHLPQSAMRGFRAALVAGTALIVVLCVFQLFPLALVYSAVLVPLVTVLYMWEVDLYEDAPLPALAFTIVWGALAGVGVGLLARHLATRVSLVPGRVTSHELLWLGTLVPLISVVLMLAGPLVLLPYRHFNDVLDGATFGGACAVTLLGAEAITNSANFLSGSLQVEGDETLWIVRLLTLGVALPLAGAGAVGAACGALWLRYRTPVRDRAALGVQGSPLVAVPLAFAAIIGINLAEVYLGEWWSLAVTVAVAVAALLALRRVIHLGLLQEAGEEETGPARACRNCGEWTPMHSFCGHCGVAMRALPKNETAARVSQTVQIAAFGALFALAAGVAILVIVLTRPGPARPPCTPGLPCGNPPEEPSFGSNIAHLSAAGPYEQGQSWRSKYGVRLRYDSRIWRAEKSTNTTLYLSASDNKGNFVLATFITAPSSVKPAQLLKRELNAAGGDFLGLERDTSAAHALLGPEVGFVPGIGAMYTATWNVPPSPSQRIEIAFQVSTLASATVLVEAATTEQAESIEGGSSSPFPYLALVDQIMDTFEWQQT